MSSRKSASSEAQAGDSRRSSLRRLSSIASFQALFNRRRSNNAREGSLATAASSSNLSLSSTVVNPPEPPPKPNNTSTNNLLQREDTLPELPEPPVESHAPPQRSSYICLPDDPIGGMPRSRTFGNLPLPTRARKTTTLFGSKSHARLPSGFLPSTRLPSPPNTTRKHSHSRLASDTRLPTIRNRVKRSDTEPLLKPENVQDSNFTRSTAFKENISLSPIKPLPALDVFKGRDFPISPPPSRPYVGKRGCRGPGEEVEPLLSQRMHSAAPSHSSVVRKPVDANREHRSIPAHRNPKDRQPTPGASRVIELQRWSSQPVLVNTTNVARHSSQHHEIKQARLLSARQAPTPPPAKTPFAATIGKVKKMTSSNQTPVSSSLETTRKLSILSPKRSMLDVHRAQPTAYWSGRLCALADRYRNEELAAHLTAPTPCKANTDKMHNPEASTARFRRALVLLHEHCKTAEAEDSFCVFQKQFAKLMGSPELSAPLPPIVFEEVLPENELDIGESTVGEEIAEGGMNEGRKMSFMDRLLGRQKRRSLVLD